MDFIKFGDLAVMQTSKEFCIMINEHFHGPFPKTTKMISMLLELFDEPDNEELIRKIEKEIHVFKRNRFWETARNR